MTTTTDMNCVAARPGDVCKGVVNKDVPQIQHVGIVQKIESGVVTVCVHGSTYFSLSSADFASRWQILLPHPPSMPLDSTGRPVVIGMMVKAAGSDAVYEITSFNRDGYVFVRNIDDPISFNYYSAEKLTIIPEPPTSGEAKP